MKIAQIEWLLPKLSTMCGAAVGAGAGALSFLSEVALQALGVPLPVVIASSAAAGMARAFGAPMGFVPAVCITCGWTVLGCVCAPAAQALIPMLPGMSGAALPANALAGVAACVSSSPWWWPKVWPVVRAKLGLAKGGAG